MPSGFLPLFGMIICPGNKVHVWSSTIISTSSWHIVKVTVLGILWQQLIGKLYTSSCVLWPFCFGLTCPTRCICEVSHVVTEILVFRNPPSSPYNLTPGSVHEDHGGSGVERKLVRNAGPSPALLIRTYFSKVLRWVTGKLKFKKDFRELHWLVGFRNHTSCSWAQNV